MAYTGLILTSRAEYSAIRNLLDVESADIADTVIEELPYLPTVETQITAAIPTYASLTGGNSTRIKTAVACWVAALLCCMLENGEKRAVKIGDYAEESKLNWTEKRAELMQYAARSLATITTRTHTRQKLMVTGGPTSSGNDFPTTWDDWLKLIEPRVIQWLEDES